MPYRIDYKDPSVTPVPCTYVTSKKVPGKTISVNEDGSALVILPTGEPRPGPGEPPTSDNFDSLWTQGQLFGADLVYRSAGQLVPGGPTVPGTPRAYKVIQ